MKRSGTVLAATVFAVSVLVSAAGPAHGERRIRIADDLIGIPIRTLHAYVDGVLAGHWASAGLYGRLPIVCPRPGASIAELSIAVLLHLRRAPGDRMQPAGRVVLRALGRAHRCRDV
ncbi:MAG: hypothetical protein OXC10_10800 [Rhodospirillaceae bacterium]|nr:hypothetical protein [Rhodospirillaceae bacterium]